MPLDYSAAEEYHVRLESGGQFIAGRMWLPEEAEWQVEVGEGEGRLAATAPDEGFAHPLPRFERTVALLEARDVRLRTCGTCAFFRRSPVEEGEGWLGYCTYTGDEPTAAISPVSLLAPDCQHYQLALGAPSLVDERAMPQQDPNSTRALPSLASVEEKGIKGIFGKMRDMLGLKKEEAEFVRAGVVERPGGQPCPVCGTRMTNRASVANADAKGEERVLSVWRCPHCAGNYLDDWFEAYVGSKAHDAERLYVVPPVEANAAAAIVVHCPRPDVKGCTCIANQHFDRWGNELETTGRRIRARESVVSL